MPVQQWIRTKLRRLVPVVAMLALLGGGTVVLDITTATPAFADTGGYPWADATALDEQTDDYGYATCPSSDTGCKNYSGLLYTLNGTTYGEADPWGYYLRNCTSYVAWKIGQEFGGRNIAGWGDASNWATAAQNAGYSLDSVSAPQVGDIGVWVHAAGGFGHVAYVASVSGSVATFDEYNVAETGAYTSTYTSQNHPGDNGQTQPDYYIHMGTPGGSPPPPPPPPPSFIMVREGNWVGAKQYLGDPWTTMAAGATDIQAAGNRFAYLTSTGELYVKQGINGPWYDEYAGVNQYVITPDYIMIRVGTWIAAKAGLTDQWTTLASTNTTNIQAAESSTNVRFAYLDSTGALYVKDGLNGTWDEEYTGVSQYVITGDYMMIDVGGWLAAKAGLQDAWTSLINTNPTDIQMAESSTNLRIAFLDSSGNFYVKDGLNGTWDEEYTGVSQFVVTPTAMYMRVGTWLAAKDGLQDAWTSLETTNTTNIQAADQADGTTWFAFMDSTGELYVKDGLNGTWNDEANVNQYVITSS